MDNDNKSRVNRNLDTSSHSNGKYCNCSNTKPVLTHWESRIRRQLRVRRLSVTEKAREVTAIRVHDLIYIRLIAIVSFVIFRCLYACVGQTRIAAKFHIATLFMNVQFVVNSVSKYVLLFAFIQRSGIWNWIVWRLLCVYLFFILVECIFKTSHSQRRAVSVPCYLNSSIVHTIFTFW